MQRGVEIPAGVLQMDVGIDAGQIRALGDELVQKALVGFRRVLPDRPLNVTVGTLT